ncbi:SERTA domain-containing protein 3 [Marasmius crinis-equi]|uniref:SERTA domain-containing protein 3 n=1 Tax=Marasmius crinis-equi TaxID=585013 RepID=A0ABR3F1B1_9AGAR
MRRRVTNGVFAFEKGGEAWNMVMAKLAGIAIGKPGRQRTAFNVWVRDKEAWIDELVEKKKQELLAKNKTNGIDVEVPPVGNTAGQNIEAKKTSDKVSETVVGGEIREDKADDGTGTGGDGPEAVKKPDDVPGPKVVKGKKKAGSGEGTRDDEDGAKDKYAVSIRQAVVKEQFEKLSPEERIQWQNKAKEEHEECKADYAALQAAGYSTDPKDRQGAIERFPIWMLEVVEEARKITGLNISVFAGGPMPSAGGGLRIIGVHAGRTIGVAGQSFGSAYQGVIESVISQIYGEFLQDCFTKEDCEAMSLGSPRPTLDVMYSENDAITFNVIPAQATPPSARPSAASSIVSEDQRQSSVATSETAVSSASNVYPRAVAVKAASTAGSVGARDRTEPAQRVLPTGGAKKNTCVSDVPRPASSTTLLSKGTTPASSTTSAPPKTLSSRDTDGGTALGSMSSKASSSTSSSLPATIPRSSATSKPSHTIAAKLHQAGAHSSANDITRSLLPPKRQAPLLSPGRMPSPPMPTYPSAINVTALKRKEKTRVSMHTGGLPPPLPSVLKERERRRQERKAAEVEARMVREKQEAATKLGEGSGSSSHPHKRLRRREASVDLQAFKESLALHKGSASSPIEVDSPATSRAPTPDLEVIRCPDPASRMSSPSASSAASLVSVQKCPSRVRASSPPGSSPIPEFPPPSQPRNWRPSVAMKQEDDEPTLLLRRKRSARDTDDSGRSLGRKRMRVEESEDEISAHLELATPSSPISGSPAKGKRTRQVMAHVQVPRGPRKGKAKSGKSSGSAPGGRSKYYAAVDTSELDVSEYLVPLPANAPLYVHLTMEMCSSIDNIDDGFVEVVRLWVELETQADFVEKGRLTTEGRPSQVSVWIGQARRAGFVPDIGDLEGYGKQMANWWWNCAPEWRH